MSNATDVCCLCGKLATAEDPITKEHVPPKQFYPKALLEDLNLNLWTVLTHRSCNNEHQADEDYFYHALFPLVANVNSRMARVIWYDLQRRAKKLQTPKLLRSILQTSKTITDGGIFLPPGVVRMDPNEYRLQQVAIKIGRCLFYRDHKRVMPYENCVDIRRCERDEDVPERYTLSWNMSKVNVNDLVPSKPDGVMVVADSQAGQPQAAYRQVFNYRKAYFEEEHLHRYSLMFWEAFMFCMAFREPDAQPD